MTQKECISGLTNRPTGQIMLKEVYNSGFLKHCNIDKIFDITTSSVDCKKAEIKKEPSKNIL